jgi:hypothetical protein
MTGKQRNKLRYNDGFLLVMMAIADGALFGISSPDDLWQQRIPDGDNETHLLWNDSASTLPIARRIENGKVSREPMTEKRFRTIFDAIIRGSDYVGITPSVHQIRRETAGKLNSNSPGPEGRVLRRLTGWQSDTQRLKDRSTSCISIPGFSTSSTPGTSLPATGAPPSLTKTQTTASQIFSEA